MSSDGQVSQPTASTLISPRLLSLDARANDEIEASLHNLPKPLMREFGHVFNDEYLKFEGGAAVVDASALTLLAIPTNQRAREDLVAVGDHIEAEKDRLLNVVSESRPMPLWDFLLRSELIHVGASFWTLASSFARLSAARDIGLTTSIHVVVCR